MTGTRLATTVGLALVCTSLILDTAVAQDLHPSRLPSPMAMARTMVGDTYVSVTYSRPYKRGRDNIFGSKESEALVPYGEVWRTGANAATQWTSTGDLTVGGQQLPAGTYSVFTVPGADSWTVHFNSRLNLSGTAARNPETGNFENAYSADNDVVVVDVAPTMLDEEVDQFTIAFEESDGGSDLVLRWITTEVRVPVGGAG